MESQQQKTPFIRRIVTGHDEQDVAKVLHDGPATNAKFPSPGVAETFLFVRSRAVRTTSRSSSETIPTTSRE